MLFKEKNKTNYFWKYLFIRFLSVFVQKKKATIPQRILYVTHSGSKAWILGFKAKRLSGLSDLNASVHYTDNFRSIPKADGYFFPHHKYFARAYRYNINLLKYPVVVMFTHFEESKRYSIPHLVWVLSKVDRVIFLNKTIADRFLSAGLKKEKVVVMPMASDENKFRYHKRDNGKVCMSMAYYPRKNPDLIFEIVKRMPHKRFLLIGKDWEKYSKFDQLLESQNFEYFDSVSYDLYPTLYEQCDIFLSTSELEGGPVPLLETMMCNMVPVVTNTGFCPDIVKHKENGFLFEYNDNPESVCKLIEDAYLLSTDTRKYVLNYTWKESSRKIDKLFIDSTLQK